MSNTPAPFLNPIFQENTNFEITEGWLYSKQEVELHGTKEHKALDFAVPIGTPVLATDDGIAVATFGEYTVPNEDGTHRTWKNLPIYYGFGLVVQILHKNGWFSYYGHLHKLIPEFETAGAYYEPIRQDNGDLYTNNLYKPLQEYGKSIQAINVKKGQIIGYSGITGMGWGVKTYDNWVMGKKYAVCDEEHVHFQVSKLKDTDEIYKVDSIDSLGIYDTYENYPKSGEDWVSLNDSKWLKGM